MLNNLITIKNENVLSSFIYLFINSPMLNNDRPKRSNSRVSIWKHRWKYYI